MRTAAVWRFGWVLGLVVVPVSAQGSTFTLIPNLSVAEEYNDNIFFRGAGEDDAGVEDFVTSINTGLSLHYSGQYFRTALTGGSSAHIFARESHENSIGIKQSATVAGEYDFTERLSLHATDRVNSVQETRTGDEGPDEPGDPRPDDPDPADDTATFLPTGAVVSNHFVSRLTYEISPRWTAGLGYSNAFSNFEDLGFDDLRHTGIANMTFQWRPTVGFGAEYAYSRFGAGNGRNTETHRGSVGAGWNIAPTWDVTGSVGAYANRSLGSNVGDTTDSVGPIWSLALTKLFEQSAVTLGGSQRITSSGGAAGTSITQSAYLRGTRDLIENLSGQLGLTFNHFDTDTGEFQTLIFGAGLRYRLNTYIQFSLDYRYRWRQSDDRFVVQDSDPNDPEVIIDTGSVDGNIVRLRATFSYPLWQGSL